MKFKKVFERTILFEGGYSDNPYDSGGKTMYGITEKVARDYGYKGEMEDLSLELAREIYKTNYWDSIRLDEIEKDTIQELMFDTGVNMGTGRGVLIAQKAYNILNKEIIIEDGIIGSQTISSINTYKYERDLAFWYVMLRAERYYDIVRANETQKEFIRGWGRRVQTLLEEVVF